MDHGNDRKREKTGTDWKGENKTLVNANKGAVWVAMKLPEGAICATPTRHVSQLSQKMMQPTAFIQKMLYRWPGKWLL